jgi:hypothetical protein
MGNQNVTTHKFVAVLNKKVDIGKVLNVLAHLSISIVADAIPEQVQEMGVVNYSDKDENTHKASKNSFVILKADNGNKIRTVRNAAKEKGILFVDFTNTMQEGTFLEQLERTKQTPEAELDYYGIVLFGEIDKISELTRKFSLWI